MKRVWMYGAAAISLAWGSAHALPTTTVAQVTATVTKGAFVGHYTANPLNEIQRIGAVLPWLK